jgi:hypothetical protein
MPGRPKREQTELIEPVDAAPADPETAPPGPEA